MRFRDFASYVAGFGFCVLVVFSGLVADREFGATKRKIPAWHIENFLENHKPNAVLALSTNSDHYQVEACLSAITSVTGRVLPTKQRLKLLNACEDILRGIVQSSAKNSYAWFVLGYVAWEKGETDAFNMALERSYHTGPTEQWLSELRVPLAERGLSELTEETTRGHELDQSLLVKSRRGIGSIVRRYIADPLFRDRITSLVETMSQDEQQRFLRTLRGEVRKIQHEN